MPSYLTPTWIIFPASIGSSASVCIERYRFISSVPSASATASTTSSRHIQLLDEHSCDFVITASEFNGEGFDRMCEFRAREGFRQRGVSPSRQAACAAHGEGTEDCLCSQR